MKGEQTMKKVNIKEYAAICRASRRGNLIARLKVRNVVEVENKGNELVKLVAEKLKEKGDFFEEISCSDPNVGTTAIGQWAESVWEEKGRKKELEEVRNGNFLVIGSWIFEKNSKEDLPEERFIRSLARLMNDLKEEAEKLGINVRKGVILDSLYFSI
jgi:hypothetical protein